MFSGCLYGASAPFSTSAPRRPLDVPTVAAPGSTARPDPREARAPSAPGAFPPGAGNVAAPTQSMATAATASTARTPREGPPREVAVVSSRASGLKIPRSAEPHPRASRRARNSGVASGACASASIVRPISQTPARTDVRTSEARRGLRARCPRGYCNTDCHEGGRGGVLVTAFPRRALEETRTPRENRDFVPAIRRVRKSNQFRFRRPIRVDRRLIACVEISNVDFSR